MVASWQVGDVCLSFPWFIVFSLELAQAGALRDPDMITDAEFTPVKARAPA